MPVFFSLRRKWSTCWACLVRRCSGCRRSLLRKLNRREWVTDNFLKSAIISFVLHYEIVGSAAWPKVSRNLSHVLSSAVVRGYEVCSWRLTAWNLLVRESWVQLQSVVLSPSMEHFLESVWSMMVLNEELKSVNQHYDTCGSVGIMHKQEIIWILAKASGCWVIVLLRHHLLTEIACDRWNIQYSSRSSHMAGFNMFVFPFQHVLSFLE